MATISDYTEDDDLSVLRERATCPICREFYNRPRKLSCCHVVCLDCVKRQVSLWHQCNFPPCPLCRAPIVTTDINNLEPALAEQDIVSIVRKYETCDICKRKENPSVKCLECKYLICHNCRPSHKEYNPLHTVVTVLTSEKEGTHVSPSRCGKHPDQYLTLYCVMCEHVLCSYCDKHLHEDCRNRFKNNELVRERFEKGLLREYASSSSAVTPLGGSSDIPACLYVQDFSLWCLNWLVNVKKGVEQCISFFYECRDSIRHKHTSDNCVSTMRVDCIMNELENCARTATELNTRIEKQIQTAMAADIAASVLELENCCINLFKLRSKYTLELVPTQICYAENDVNADYKCVRLESKAILKAVSESHTFLGIYTVAKSYITNEKVCEYIREFSSLGIRKCTVTTAAVPNSNLFVPDKLVAVFHPDSNVMNYTNPTARSLNSDYLNKAVMLVNIDSSSTSSRNCGLVLTNDVFTNVCLNDDQVYLHKDALKKTNDIPVTNIRSMYFREIPVSNSYRAYFVQNKWQDYREKVLDARLHIVIRDFGWTYREYIEKGEVALVSHFVNAVWLHSVFVKNILFKGTELATELFKLPVCCIIGNAVNGLGLEIMFFRLKEADRKETECVLINVPRMKLHSDYRELGTICYSPAIDKGVNSDCIRDENGNFCIFWSTKDGDTQIVYRSARTEDIDIDSALVLHNGDYDHEVLLRKTYLKADLLCNLKQGLTFVSRGIDLDEMHIGKIEVKEETIKVYVMVTLHQKSLARQIEKLIPLAMIDTTNNEVLLVCSIDGENDKLAMIWPEKSGSGVLEILEVKYPSTEFSNASIVDLQIDPVGNIMYVLENEDGKYCCACTRYFMPKTETANDQ